MQSASPSKKRHNVWQWFEEEELRMGQQTGKHGKQQVYCTRCLERYVHALRDHNEITGVERTD